MPNVGIHGYGGSKTFAVRGMVKTSLRRIGLGDDAVTELISSVVERCDMDDTQSPYLRLFTTEPEQIFPIIEAFWQDGIFEDIEILSAGCAAFIEKTEMMSEEKWKEALAKKGILCPDKEDS